ncbi:glycosyltransferase [Phaeobacter sp. CAU 1743]|uniref:glycosyltransferase family 2 protein n=1 Tax=Phaeobacter sp. CAU 1743 TaxID=3140367 RepID=UPI0023B468F4
MTDQFVQQAAATEPTSKTAAVVIGRNEGARLKRCILSLQDQVGQIVYVDSGSTDGSVAAARDLGADVVELDMSRPFTAARARNAGVAALPAECDLVQFVDGDCEVAPGWIDAARQFLAGHDDVAVVCGRRREQHPEVSVYNRLCDAEWDTPVGQALACGGDALMRLAPLRAVGGYRETLIAGEEPELCVRLRQAGWQIWRLDTEMTRHDAQIIRMSQWAKRGRRAGHAFAEGAALHGASPERHWVHETRRALVWGAGLPLALAVLALLLSSWALLGFAIYPLQVLRLARRIPSEQAFFTVLGKFPEALGALEFHMNRLRGRKREILEYK